MELGSTLNRGIVLKLRAKLKGLIAEHEVLADDSSHRILLADLIKLTDEANERYRKIPGR